MTPSILRAVLACAILFGVGIIANVFSERQGGAERTAATRPSQQLAASRPQRTTRISREANERRLLKAVRRELVGRGYLSGDQPDTIDIATKSAILAFEFDHNLPLTARPADPLLKSLIFAQTPTGAPRSTVPVNDDAQQVIVEVQRALAHLGYGRSTSTGELDPETRKAIRKFERARGLQLSGRVSAPLIESLGPAFDSARVGNAEPDDRADAG